MKYNALLVVVTLIHHTYSQRRYIIDDDNDLNRSFAFPIDLCFQSKVITDIQFQKYTCSQSGNSVTKTVYTDPFCKSQITNSTWTNNEKSPCGGPKFSCIGEDQYQNISYHFQSTCSPALIAVPMVLGCYCDTDTTSYSTNCINVPMSGNISFFTDTTCSNSTTNSTNSTLTSFYDLNECNEVMDLTQDLNSQYHIYAKQTGCLLTPPTLSPTFSPIYTDYMNALENLPKYYKYMAGGFVFIFGVIAILSFIDAKICRINDYYSIGAIVSMTLQTVDMMSDCFFTAEIGLRYKMDASFRNMIMLYASMGFIIIPSFIALFQLYFHAKKHWLDSDYVRQWLSKYSTFLLGMSLITGSSFAAVSLLNSYIFQIQIFDMGLTHKQLKGFNTRRIWSVVVLENIPQLGLQSYYFWIRLQAQDASVLMSILGGENFITVSSMCFSIISLIISLMSLTIERAINKTQDYSIISMDITGDCMDTRAPKCRTMSSKLKKYISRIIGVDINMIEIVKPMYVAKGLSLDIIIYVNENRQNKQKQMYEILIEANENGKLPQLLQKAWKLKGVPIISNILQQNIESVETKKTVSKLSQHIEASKNVNNNIVNNMNNEQIRKDSQLIHVEPQNNMYNEDIGAYNQVYTASNTARNSRRPTGVSDYNMSMPGQHHDMIIEGGEYERTPTPPPPPPPCVPPPMYNPNAKPAFPNKIMKNNVGVEMSDAQSKISESSDRNEKSETETKNVIVGYEKKEKELMMVDNKSLKLLNSMGYKDKQKNMLALRAGDGNLSATIQYLVDNENDNSHIKQLEVSITIDNSEIRSL